MKQIDEEKHTRIGASNFELIERGMRLLFITQIHKKNKGHVAQKIRMHIGD